MTASVLCSGSEMELFRQPDTNLFLRFKKLEDLHLIQARRITE